MIDKLANTFAVLVITASMWLGGFGGQKLRNKLGTKEWNAKGKAPWTYLFGVRPGVEKVYVRQAYMQILALMYCCAGLFAVWFLDKGTLKHVMMGLGIGMLLAIPLGIVEFLAKRKS
jgi:hypothetical protein